VTDEYLPADRDGEQVAAEHEQFAFDDAAYVLGALEGADLRAYTDHLDRCIRCQAQVAQLRGMPELLQRADPSAWEPSQASALPETLLPALMRDVSAERRRHRIRASLSTLAAACLVAVLAVVGSNIWSDARAPQPHPQALQVVGVADTPVSADVTLTAVKTGTRIQMRCQVPGSSYPGLNGTGEFHLVVFNRVGDHEQLSSWESNPDYTVSVLSQWPKPNIAKVEITDDQGHPVLQVTL
jgi:hypothetical protein